MVGRTASAQLWRNPVNPDNPVILSIPSFLSRRVESAHTAGVEVLDDTTPEAKRVLLELTRRASMDDRLRLAFGMTDIVRRLACDEIRRSNPDATDVELRRLMALRFLEPELADAVIAYMDRLSE